LFEEAKALLGLGPEGIVELCGIAKFRIEHIQDSEAAVWAATDTTWRKMVDALRKSDKDIDRALAEHLEGIAEGERAIQTFKVNNPQCVDRRVQKGCEGAYFNTTARLASLPALLQVASTSADVDVYVMALRACEGTSTSRPRECEAFTYAGWAARDPDNALPLLREGYRRGLTSAPGTEEKIDGSRETAVLFEEAAKRPRLSLRNPPYARVTSLPSFAESPPLVQLAIVTGLSTSDSAGTIMASLPAARFCSARAMADYPSRHDTCGSLASLVARDSTTVVGARVAADIGSRLGWPTEKTQALREEYDLVTKQLSAHFSPASMKNLFTCDGQRQLVERLQRQLEIGERAVLREPATTAGHAKGGVSGVAPVK
jgi:hypothetical protein